MMLPIPRRGHARDGRRPATPRSRSPASSGSRSPIPPGPAGRAAARRATATSGSCSRAATRRRRSRRRCEPAPRAHRYRSSAMQASCSSPTYELGHQPLARRRAGGGAARRAATTCVRSTCRSSLGPGARRRGPTRVAFSVPMHTAARLARELAPGIDAARSACFGLYAGDVRRRRRPRSSGRDPGRRARALGRATTRRRSSPRPPPARDLLPPLDATPTSSAADESARRLGRGDAGCAHRCRHCPVPGRLRRPHPHHRRRHGARRHRAAGRARAPGTSRSATPTSSTACTTRCASSRRCTSASPTSRSTAR